MTWIPPALALAALLVATPAIGSFHGALDERPPDRLFVLAMSGTSFNGLRAPDTPLLEAYLGERVRFMLLATEAHPFHLHGHPWLLDDGRIVDTFVVDADRPHVFDVPAGGADGHAGDWLYHCHINVHVAAGMWGVFRVYPFRATILPGGTTVELSRLGVPLDGATLDVELDGAPLPAHVAPLGSGRYVIHADLPPAGVLVVTATHPDHGTSVARASLDGSALPALTTGLEHHHAHP